MPCEALQSYSESFDLLLSVFALMALDRAMAIARKQPRSQNTTTHSSTPKRDTPQADRTILIMNKLGFFERNSYYL
jgi:hypothetical protein